MEKKSPLRTAISELMGGAAETTGTSAAAAEILPEIPVQKEASSGRVVPLGNNVRPCAVLTEDIVIEGSLTAENDVMLAGSVHGNVKCAGKLVLQGKVQGDISASEIEMLGARVRGKTTCAGKLTLNADSMVVGNMESGELILQGKVNGNIRVEGTADIKNSALVMGDLEIGSVAVEHGAVVTGRIITKSAENLSQIFSELM